MGKEKIRIGSRGSNLAIKQVEEIIEMINEDFEYEIKKYKTRGDIDKKTPIFEIEGTDFFTDEIEKGLLNDEIDVAVHSAKDLPDIIPSNLCVIALTEAKYRNDVLISKNKLKLLELPERAKIGTCSQRRKEQLIKYRPDLQIVDIRGNIEERIRILEESNLDGIIVAEAGIRRLGLDNYISEIISEEIISPHPLQGSLAIEAKIYNNKMIEIFNKIENRKKVLYICIENSCRSQIAETITNYFYWQKLFAQSAGSKFSGKVNPLAIELIKKSGIDISKNKSKGFNDLPNIRFDYIITMGCGDECPFYPGAKRINWEIPDPKDKDIQFFLEVKKEIERKIKTEIL
ncbi:MAG TPA: hydroxymethylbilane synthase [bacterium]|nr:hydroxymethylbilane synthase [bacterium]HOL47115.1 hydroxymethylbilane synthase [bacterium]HPQ18869.1 hydroxymethylbilane synthase [bacterium]